jgi:hypothetical protein
MGSTIIINDTLQISKDQGFPLELDIVQHLSQSYVLENVIEKVYSFKDKSTVRLYQQPPVRNFLVENINGKWVYWGLAHVLTVMHDYENKVTSGTFRIIYLNTPQEMRDAHHLIDQNQDTNYFS